MTLAFRTATKKDLPKIIALLMDDDIGGNREHGGDSVDAEYLSAFDEMQAAADSNYMLLAERDGELVGVLQLVFVPGLSRKGTKRAIVESVRVSSQLRDGGIGTALMKEAIRRAKEAGCRLVQLTSDKRRTRAHLFYRRLGFEQSHVGFKKEL